MDDDVLSSRLPARLVVVAGTYDGVLAGWDSRVDEKGPDDDVTEGKKKNDKSLLDMLNSSSGGVDENSFLKMNFAMAVHDGSVRSLSIASAEKRNHTQKSSKRKKDSDDDEDDKTNNKNLAPDSLISCGFDESINIFSLVKKLQSGELKTPSDLGTPTCSSFAPPNDPSPTHVLIGLSSGKIIIYRRKDWSVQHILACHDDKGVQSIAVHPSGKMALSGGRDGKICLWDLMRGRLAFVQKIGGKSKGRKPTVNDIIWSDDGKRYAFCTHEGNISAREMATGNDLLDINLPTTSKPNQICFIGGEDGLFLAAACNDGGLPVFAVGSIDEEEEEDGTRRALMAIEPVEGVATAGDERFKCIESVKGGSGFLVITANSGGIISLIDLEGAARMMLDDNDSSGQEDDQTSDDDSESNISEDDDDDDVAAEILNSVRIGSGARITTISVWSQSESEDILDEKDVDEGVEAIADRSSDPVINDDEDEEGSEESEENKSKKRKITTLSVGKRGQEIEMDSEALEKARALVSQAKKRDKRKNKKKKKKTES